MSVDELDAASATARVLVVSPPGSWRDSALEALRQAWFVVDTLDDGVELGAGRLPRADLAIVDLGLREPSGLAVCGAVRARSSMLLLAVSTTPVEDEIVQACEAGADGYLPLSASPRILLARVRGLLRRTPPTSRIGDRAGMNCGAIELNPETGLVVMDGVAVELRPAELEVLELLLLHGGRVVSRADLAARLTMLDASNVDLESCLRRLREQLDLHRSGCTIVTVRKAGVRLVASGCDRDPAPPNLTVRSSRS